MSYKIKLSIVTICLNADKYIEKTIKSIIPILKEDVEYIIVDGKSTDATIKIIEKYNSFISKWISEKDQGIYDAMNKGISLCNGEWIAIINAGDLLLINPLEIFSCIDEKYEVVYGDGIIRIGNNIKRVKARKKLSKDCFYRFPIFHPSVFIRKDVYKKWGVFDSNFKIAGDYDLILRFLSKGVQFKYFPITFSEMDGTGVSNSDWRRSLDEMKIILLRNGFYKGMLKLKFIIQSFKTHIYYYTPKFLTFLGKRY